MSVSLPYIREHDRDREKRLRRHEKVCMYIMYVCIYVCMYVCTCVYVHMYMSVYMHVCM